MPSEPRRHSLRAWLAASLFALVGGAGLVWLVLRANPALLWRTVERGAAWLPALFVIEGARIAIEAWGSHALYERPIPYLLLLRATLVAYAVAALAPAGRATGEAVKAGMLRGRTELSDTAAAATTIQTCSLLSLGLWSIVCATVTLPVSAALASTLAIQAVVVLLGAAMVRGLVRTSLLRHVLERFGSGKRAAAALSDVGAHAATQQLRTPLAAFMTSRALNLAQCGLLLVAITGHTDVVKSLLSFGVSTVSGSLGDSVPAQIGVMDGSFSAAASALTITREDALAFALLTHAFQIAWIAVGLVTPLVWRALTPSRDAVDCPPNP